MTGVTYDPYADPYADAPAEDPHAGVRAYVVSTAQSYVGTVHARRPGEADETGRHVRTGWETLLEIFHNAAPGLWHDDVIKYYTGYEEGHLPSWCGIFATHCLLLGGAGVGTWHVGVGISGVGGIVQTHDPKPGDVGYFDAHQHHCVIESVDGDTITSIDGNSGMDSEIIGHTRHRGEFAGFFTAFP
jgi:hypothetical protein